jgi:hypothetical protein
MEKHRRVEKIIIDGDDFRHDFKGHHDHRPGGPREFRRHRHERENTVRLFTDRQEMVAYVNGLENIDNVDVFKIEDDLYKVFVTRFKKQQDQEEPDTD